jgi:type II secretory pathway pseudopilin PulG
MIETIIAITVIVIGTAAALSMLRTSLSGNELVGEKEVAINLALEALDGLKNIRDTNYLLYPAYADSCWDTFGATGSGCSGATHFNASKSYFFVRSFSGSGSLDWKVVQVSSGTNGYLNLFSAALSDGRVMDIYAPSTLSETGFTSTVTRAFRRTMTLTFNTAHTAYDATVTVSWQSNNVTHSISLTRTIANIY